MTSLIDSAWSLGLTLLNALMAVIPNVPFVYFTIGLAVGWAIYLVGLFLYINILRGTSDRILRGFTNFLWLYMMAWTLGFVLTRESLLMALGWMVVALIAFEILFVMAMAFKARWERYPRFSFRWWLALLIGVPLFLAGLPYDITYNLTVGRLHFLSKPRLFNALAPTPWRKVLGPQLTFTAELKRYKHDLTETWRRAQAAFICDTFIDWADRGHCD